MIIIKKSSIFLFIFLTILSASVPSYAKWRNGWDSYSYKSPCWMPDSQHIIYIKHVSHYKYHHGIVALLSFAEYVKQGDDVYICKLNINTQKEEIIKHYKYIEHEYTGKREYYEYRGKKRIKLDKILCLDSVDCSPDGKWLCVEAGGVYSEIGVFLMKIDGTGVKKIAPGGESPRFSPDSKHILFRGYKSLWLMDVDGRNKRTVIKNVSIGIWHPNGKKIGFFVSKEKIDFWTINVDGTDKKAMFQANAYPIDWSPDGTRISFCSGIRNLDGKDIYGKTGISDKKWSPDGQKLLGEPMKTGSIGVFNIKSKELKVLTKDESVEY